MLPSSREVRTARFAPRGEPDRTTRSNSATRMLKGCVSQAPTGNPSLDPGVAHFGIRPCAQLIELHHGPGQVRLQHPEIRQVDGGSGGKCTVTIMCAGLSSRGSEMAIDKAVILEAFRTLSGRSPGIESWITDNTDDEIFARLGDIEADPLSKVQLNQLLVLASEADVSDGFFKYYWLSNPAGHPYNVEMVAGFEHGWQTGDTITALKHLVWGLSRLYIDALLFFGNIRSGYRFLRTRSESQLGEFFRSKCFDTEAIRSRGPALRLRDIAKDKRYLISEMACKSYDSESDGQSAMKRTLLAAWQDHQSSVGGQVTIKALLDGTYVKKNYASTQQQLLFAGDDILSEEVGDEEGLEASFDRVLGYFSIAREGALRNTRLYLSMVNDLDVYVATSMRTRQDFRNMADKCEAIFTDSKLKGLELRYFDPTLSAAAGHEDKGLIECLMVKCAKVLVYCAGDKESYGKDAEAAMALSQGKPVIFLCDEEVRERFYREIHPLSRLIDFESGVAVGALVTSSLPEVVELLRRLFENRMEYDLNQEKPGSFRLVERLTKSVARLQTGDDLLRETFWNYYGNRPGSDL
jgi:hypothetical protein